MTKFTRDIVFQIRLLKEESWTFAKMKTFIPFTNLTDRCKGFILIKIPLKHPFFINSYLVKLAFERLTAKISPDAHKTDILL